MLKESFIASVGATTGSTRNDSVKDGGIFVVEHLPVVQQKSTFKKSVTAPNCLAVSESHIFAAQADKAVVNVYNREKGSQEAIVPFTEKITCIALACNDTLLILGTREGRLFLWETCSGRQITTAQSHLQTVNELAVDTASSLVVSVSEDSSAHIWSLPALLTLYGGAQVSTPLRTFNSHRSPIRAVALGYGASCQNFVATAAEDKTCLLWDLHSNAILATVLLTSVPTCLQIEPANRAVYVGYEDGSLQQLDLLDLTAAGARRVTTTQPVQPGDHKRWTIPSNTHGALLSMNISFDATIILSGHQSGAVLAWTNGQARPLPIHPPISGPVTNLHILPVEGFSDTIQSSYKVHAIVKPKFGAFQTSGIDVPGDYALQLHMFDRKQHSAEAFRSALTSALVPQSWITEGLAEIGDSAKYNSAATNGRKADLAESEDFMALETGTAKVDLARQNTELKAQLASLRRVQMVSFDQIEKLSREKQVLLQREQQRLQVVVTDSSTLRRTNAHDEDQEMER